MLSKYLSPVSAEDFIDKKKLTVNQWANQIRFFDGAELDLSDYQLALIGVPEDRENPEGDNCAHAPNAVRSELFQLFNWEPGLQLIDMGNLKKGKELRDTYAALSIVVQELLQHRVIPIILGGTHDLTYGQFTAYENLGHTVNMVVFDERINLMSNTGEVDSSSFLYQILAHQPNYLFNYTQAGFQYYLTDPQMIRTLEKMHLDAYRLGYLRENMERIEPLVRDADIISLDLSCLKYADAHGQKHASPHGFLGEEACRLARYAGISDQVSSFGVYEFFPEKDPNKLTAKLVAQVIWHFVDGFYARKGERPELSQGSFTQYTVALEQEEQEIVFMMSRKSERWWMKVPIQGAKDGRTYEIVPCLYEDYQQACQEEIPDRWMNTYLKLSHHRNQKINLN